MEEYGRSAADVARDLGLPDQVVAQLAVLWGKSAGYGGGRMNLLLSHLLDTAAVAECLWEEYLAPSTRELLDRVSGGEGRRFFMWLCGIHDCGKAVPAFQSIDLNGAVRVRAAGLKWRDAALKRGRWRHDKAGAKVLRDTLAGVWEAEEIEWLWPLVAGHHGSFPSGAVFAQRHCGRFAEHHGRGAAWRTVQQAVVEVFTRCLGYDDLSSVRPVAAPRKAEQLCLSGFVVMADWIASDTRQGRFQGVDDLARVSLAGARERADRAWRALKLRGGWGQLPVPDLGVDLVRSRFGDPARASQRQLVEAAHRLPAPGLVFVEAPMGEGKTKGALAAAEVLAARFGLDGVYMGMPTQATCDPMFSLMRSWVENFDGGLPDQVALLHGKKMFNPQWRELWEAPAEDAADPFGTVGEDGLDEFGLGAGQGGGCEAEDGPSEWFLGRHRGLLSPFVVGTIDQLLFAAARTKHVMLRFAGLAGKVVILDEVHAADVYMSQFLFEALRWLGQAGVPVLLLSATLPPAQRRALAVAYLEGAVGETGLDLASMPEPEGYPSVTCAYADGERRPAFAQWNTGPWRGTQPVQVQWLPDVSEEGTAVAETVTELVSDGGVALVVLNSVPRAQAVYRHLVSRFPGQVHLLHGRLCAAHRAERTGQCLHLLGPEAGGARPERMVVVATQLAEQSFDVDADVLVTDLAPVDLLLQRIGRLHRHEGTRRPEYLSSARVLVTGVGPGGEVPDLLGASEGIYGRYLLLRTAAVLIRETGSVGEGGGGVVSVPAQVPELVAEVYGQEEVCPPSWARQEAASLRKWAESTQTREEKARALTLSRAGEWERPTLAGLHQSGTPYTREENLRALVRDGEPSAEVVIVRRDARGFRALDGTRIGVQGEASEQMYEAVLGGTTRLPAKAALTRSVEEELRPLPGWAQVPWLAYARALVLEESGQAAVGDFLLGYDEALGLQVEQR